MDFYAINTIFIHIMKKVINIILHDEIQQIFDNFAFVSEVMVVFYSLDRKILKRGLNRSNSDYCHLIQEKFYGSEPCLTMDNEKCRECQHTMSTVSYVCHAGIGEMIIPISIEKRLVGYAMIGQYRLTKELPEKVKKDAQENGMETAISKAFYKLPYFSEEKLKNILGLFTVLVDYIIAREIVTVSGERLLSRATAYIEDNVTRNIALDEIAELLDKSRSTISHLFKKSLGISFKQYVIETKLKRADDLFRASPWLTIEAVAFQLGFNDQFYFSRLYKKYRSIPPTAYRDNFRKK
jgi:AraC-like DNA-binding protein/ligand-binding sensor protein